MLSEPLQIMREDLIKTRHLIKCKDNAPDLTRVSKSINIELANECWSGINVITETERLLVQQRIAEFGSHRRRAAAKPQGKSKIVRDIATQQNLPFNEVTLESGAVVIYDEL